tara:strand:+ start:224 stop:838 length:615 start_codon:yes stop_codon:yes gene_type:complete
MNTFVEIPANNMSIACRKLVFGVGINDADYMTSGYVNGKAVKCPYYQKWKGMLERCYSANCQKNKPTYIGCSVHTDWHTFSVFKAWMQQQDWAGNELDKDLLVQGNKVYGPYTCLFLPHSINSLLTDSKAARGKWPIGAYLKKSSGRYAAQCNIKGKRVSLGYYDIPEEASAAYKAAKYKVIAEVALTQPEPIRSALLAYRILD